MTPGAPNKKPSNAALQDMRRRMNQGPRIFQAQTTADDGVARANVAQQRADEAHNRNTNSAVNDAHTAAEGAKSAADGAQGTADTAKSKADAAHVRSTNAAVDAAHDAATSANTNADGRLSLKNGGVVDGNLNAKQFFENFTLTNTSIPANSTVTWSFGSSVNHITMAHVADGANGWILLPTVGSTPLFIVINNATRFAIRNSRTIGETVHGRIWQEAY